MSDLHQHTKEVDSKTVESLGRDRGPGATVAQHQADLAVRTPAAVPAVARALGLSLVGRPEPVILPYSDDPTVKKDKVESIRVQKGLIDVVAAAKECERLEKEKRAKEEEIAKHEQAKEAEQRAMDNLSERHIKVKVDKTAWTYPCDPDRVTVSDITAFIIERHAILKDAKLTLSVDDQLLTVESQRALLKHHAMVTACECYIEIMLGRTPYRYCCDPDCVTLDDIAAFFVQQDENFKKATFVFSVGGQSLTVESQRRLLKNNAIVVASQCYIEVVIDSNDGLRLYCDPDCVTVNDIVAFIVEHDERFKNATLKLQVGGQSLTVESQRELLKHRSIVQPFTAPAGGVHTSGSSNRVSTQNGTKANQGAHIILF